MPRQTQQITRPTREALAMAALVLAGKLGREQAIDELAERFRTRRSGR